jgi:hypothetical protein
VPNAAGVPVPPSLVVGPVKPGRTLVLAPACADASRLEALAHGADVLVADACSGGGGDSNGKGSSLEAGVAAVAAAAEAAGVERLVFTGFRAG